MKNIAVGFVVALLVVAMFNGCSKDEGMVDGSLYQVQGIVTDVFKQRVTVNVDMPNGEIHEFVAYGNGYVQGQLITLTLNDVGTTDCYHDDVVEGLMAM